MKVTMIVTVIGAFWYCDQRIAKSIGALRNHGTDGDCQNYSITKIGQNTEKSPGDFSRFVVTKTPVRDSQLTLI